MGIELWLLIGSGATLVLLGCGFGVAWWARGWQLQLWQARHAEAIAEIEELLAQGEAGLDAARLHLATSRRVAEARAAGDARTRRELLLRAAAAVAPPEAAGGPAGEPQPGAGRAR